MSQEKTVMRHYARYISSKEDFMKFYVDPSDIKTWYVLVYNILGHDDEYKGGEYIFELKITTKYPSDPPTFMVKTPNGLYKENENVCVNVGHFHPEGWRSIFGVSGFIKMLTQGLIDWKGFKTREDNLGIIDSTLDYKKQCAAKSVEYNNQHNKDILDKINANFAEYSAKWDK